MFRRLLSALVSKNVLTTVETSIPEQSQILTRSIINQVKVMLHRHAVLLRLENKNTSEKITYVCQANQSLARKHMLRKGWKKQKKK